MTTLNQVINGIFSKTWSFLLQKFFCAALEIVLKYQKLVSEVRVTIKIHDVRCCDKKSNKGHECGKLHACMHTRLPCSPIWLIIVTYLCCIFSNIYENGTQLISPWILSQLYETFAVTNVKPHNNIIFNLVTFETLLE